ncbi:hypothetical protein B0J12DRAFT_55231 [Macrophomina phaseolina]|uniref:Rhodopsin domain-containing protein n=1 Tax=Macrophomina phaseolina TaxID=35725 RepID=A0ABQ8GHM5_9PEZI|nr:hypothetical protein B0J12DRAFT_55231 [Macrophomina phaseolina]
MAAASSTAAEDRRWIVLTMVCLVLALGLPSLALRGYVKLQVRKVITVDDWIMLLASVLWVGYIVCQIAACANGLGAHTADLREDSYYYLVGTAHNGDVVEALRFWYACTLGHVLAAAVIRISIGLSIAHYSPSTIRRWIVIVDLVLSSLASVIFSFLLVFQCSPITDFWSRNRADSEENCDVHPITNAWFAFCAVSATSDSVLSGFPIAACLKAGISWRKRAALGVLIVFALSNMTTSALQISQITSLRNTADLTFSAADFACYALLSPSLALVGANLSTLGPWLKELGWDMSDSTSNTMGGRKKPRGLIRGGRTQVNVMRGHGDDVEAVLDAAVLQGLGRLEGAVEPSPGPRARNFLEG